MLSRRQMLRDKGRATVVLLCGLPMWQRGKMQPQVLRADVVALSGARICALATQFSAKLRYFGALSKNILQNLCS